MKMADLENVSLLGNRLKKRSRFRICLYVGIFLLILAAAATVLSTAVFYGLRSRYLYRHAAVAADAAQCSVIGTDILWKGGTAVDAAIASCLCLGVVNLHSTGIGGGGFMVVYNATTNTSTVIDFREVAPMSAYEDMYNEDPNLGLNGGPHENTCCTLPRRHTHVTCLPFPPWTHPCHLSAPPTLNTPMLSSLTSPG